MLKQLLAADRDLSVNDVDQQLVALTLLVELYVLLVYLHVVLLVGLVLTVINNLVSLAIKTQHDLLGGVPQGGAEREFCENLGDYCLEVFVDLLRFVVLLECGGQVSVRDNIPVN